MDLVDLVQSLALTLPMGSEGRAALLLALDLRWLGIVSFCHYKAQYAIPWRCALNEISCDPTTTSCTVQYAPVRPRFALTLHDATPSAGVGHGGVLRSRAIPALSVPQYSIRLLPDTAASVIALAERRDGRQLFTHDVHSEVHDALRRQFGPRHKISSLRRLRQELETHLLS